MVLKEIELEDKLSDKLSFDVEGFDEKI